MTYNPDDRISRADAAKLARKSEDTLRRRATQHGLEVVLDPVTKKVTYRVQDLVEIGLLKVGDLSVAGTASEAAELLRAREENAKLRALLAEREGQLSNTQTLVETLGRQLSEKDSQIKKYQGKRGTLTGC